jgi:hypothetical protein
MGAIVGTRDGQSWAPSNPLDRQCFRKGDVLLPFLLPAASESQTG